MPPSTGPPAYSVLIGAEINAQLEAETTVDITANDFVFQAKGSVPKFAGWLAVYGGPAVPVAPQVGTGFSLSPLSACGRYAIMRTCISPP